MGFLSFEEAKTFTHSLKLRSTNEWRTYFKTHTKPNNIPANPNVVYAGFGWTNWGDWLGTNRIAVRHKKFRSFEDGRYFAKSLNFKSVAQWQAFASSNKRPEDIPAGPPAVYKNKGWINWSDWLGK